MRWSGRPWRSGARITTISAGGGLPVPYKEDESYVDLDKYFRAVGRDSQPAERSIWPSDLLGDRTGTILSAESGYLIAEVRSVKQMGDNLFVLVDAGFNDLARPVMYGAYHPISVARAAAAMRPSEQQVDVVIGGPLCESGDIFTQREGGYVDSAADLPIRDGRRLHCARKRRCLRIRDGQQLQQQDPGRRRC